MTRKPEGSSVLCGLHPDDVVRVLVEQHDLLRGAFALVRESTGTARAQAFSDLAHLLTLHESLEEQVLRPVTVEIGEVDVARARLSEELRAQAVLARLMDLDADSDEFDLALGQLEASVLDHAGMEEAEELPAVLAAVDEDVRRELGRAVRMARTVSS
ncbi:hemerythrin domain-containing protein [Phycicoccus sp. 3266]|jgi:hypothetical protein|uniref:hemerythrin domain-containing protein n=1 Tax=Phycicoccus sp. 3266 TaxID=2817751 RepID=UPI00286267FE|nr:hemerythrin domain-containing protein [Phycicoccus sp. 3266]MDR6864745.1 hypothetical protein [Phycicoccus sp. 3266]